MKKILALFGICLVICGLAMAHILGGSEENLKINAKPYVTAAGVTIPAEEMEFLKVSKTYFDAVNAKDVNKLKAIFPNFKKMNKEEEAHLLKLFEGYNFYILHGAEDVRLENNVLKGTAVFTIDVTENTKHVGRKFSCCLSRVEIVKKNGKLGIKSWNSIRPKDLGIDDMGFFKAFAEKKEKAMKRYGIENLVNWGPLKG
jgi:hypothetical protein